MSDQDIRWIQSLDNYYKAFQQLEKGVELATEKALSDIEKEGLIQRFEYTQELAWKTIKSFYTSVGEENIQGSRDAFRIATERNLIQNGDVLMRTIKSRNLTVHSYNEKTAEQIFHEIVEEYYAVFKELLDSLKQQKEMRGL